MVLDKAIHKVSVFMKLYKQYPLKKKIIFTIYQNYTLALI